MCDCKCTGGPVNARGHLVVASSHFDTSPASSFCGVIGREEMRTPVASATALAMAAAPGITGGSQTPLAPNGPESDGTWTMMVYVCGTSTAIGIGQSANVLFSK